MRTPKKGSQVACSRQMLIRHTADQFASQKPHKKKKRRGFTFCCSRYTKHINQRMVKMVDRWDNKRARPRAYVNNRPKVSEVPISGFSRPSHISTIPYIVRCFSVARAAKNAIKIHNGPQPRIYTIASLVVIFAESRQDLRGRANSARGWWRFLDSRETGARECV